VGAGRDAGWDDARRRVLAAALDAVIPGDGVSPGAGEAGGAAYVEGLLRAFDVDPPRIWAGGPFSGRHGGAASFDEFLELGPWELHAWRHRVGEWAVLYDDGLAALGDDFAELDDAGRATRLDDTSDAFRELLFIHACESLYGDPVYGGNRAGAAWQAIEFRGDSQPAGYTDEEVTNP
jgi:gluconate 2-dehydrogenase gamma chain